MPGKDYYAILGVSKTASDDEIKKAFRRLAHEHHPDKGGDPSKFKDVNEAYQILGDKQKRGTYDRFGSGAFENGGAGPGFGGFGGQGFDFNFNAGDMGDLGDILGEMFGFGGVGTSARPKRGRNIEIDVALTFREAVFGADKSVKLYRQTTCSTCKGNGAEPGSKIEDCKTCSGTGQVKQAQKTMFGVFHSVMPCKECNGRGKKPEKPCHACRGYGVEKREETVSLRIPPGVDVDTVLQVEGQGETPANGGKAGDLIVRLNIQNDSKFEREGHDLLTIETLPFTLLTLGGSVEVETIDGKETIRVNEGTPTGTVITLKGKGVPFQRGGRGNQLIRLEADVPRKLSKEQKELLDRLRNSGI